MSGPTRVLVLTAFPAIGGPLPKLAPLVAEGLQREGCEVRVAGWSAHSAGNEPLVAKLAGRSGDLRRVLRRVREWRPGVLYVPTAHNRPALLRDVPLALSLPQGRPPLVIHFHGSESDRLDGRGWAPFDTASRLLVRRAAAVLLLSEEERREWRRHYPDVRFEVVLNPFVPPQAAGEAPLRREGDAPVLFCVARLIRAKGVFDLLDAFALLRRRIPCRLQFAGSGPEEQALRRRIDLMGIEDEVDVLGYVAGDDLRAAYERADVFVLPSYFAEGFPLAVMEAMSYGLPVVTTPIRGCADHLVEGENALFVAARDPELLAGRLTALLGDPELRRRMGAANRDKVADFAPRRVMPAYAAVLEDVARSAASAQ